MSDAVTYPQITFIPIEELVKPADGKLCLLGRWWVVHPTQGALIFKRYTPQCNSHRSMPERLVASLYPGCVTEFIPVAYVEDDPWTH